MAYPAPSFRHAEGLGLDGWTGEWCGDVWKTIVNLRSTRSDLEVFVLNCDYGIGVIRRGHPQSMLSTNQEEIAKFSYPALDINRESFLNLKPPTYLWTFTKSLSLEMQIAS